MKDKKETGINWVTTIAIDYHKEQDSDWNWDYDREIHLNLYMYMYLSLKCLSAEMYWLLMRWTVKRYPKIMMQQWHPKWGEVYRYASGKPTFQEKLEFLLKSLPNTEGRTFVKILM